MVSRAEGYRRGAGKEEGGLREAARFFREKVDVPLERITGPDDNYRFGDFRAPSGVTIECKRQPIDPGRFRQNFVEVFEVTNNAKHKDGALALSVLLEMTPEQLKTLSFEDCRTRPSVVGMLGSPLGISVSITSIAASAYTVYTNPDKGHLFLYQSSQLIESIRKSVTSGELCRGKGRSNEDTFAVMVDMPPMRWRADPDGRWNFTGVGDEQTLITSVRKVCLPRGDGQTE